MTRLENKIGQLWLNEEGLTTVEYAVAAGLISVAVIAAFQALGLSVSALIAWLATQIVTP